MAARSWVCSLTESIHLSWLLPGENQRHCAAQRRTAALNKVLKKQAREGRASQKNKTRNLPVLQGDCAPAQPRGGRSVSRSEVEAQCFPPVSLGAPPSCQCRGSLPFFEPLLAGVTHTRLSMCIAWCCRRRFGTGVGFVPFSLTTRKGGTCLIPHNMLPLNSCAWPGSWRSDTQFS